MAALTTSGAWSRSVLIILADHSRDWSLPTSLIGLAAVLNADPMLAGNVAVSQNGGADLLYWTGPAQQRSAAVARMRNLAPGYRRRPGGAYPAGAEAGSAGR